MQNFISLWYTVRVLLALSTNFTDNPRTSQFFQSIKFMERYIFISILNFKKLQKNLSSKPTHTQYNYCQSQYSLFACKLSPSKSFNCEHYSQIVKVTIPIESVFIDYRQGKCHAFSLSSPPWRNWWWEVLLIGRSQVRVPLPLNHGGCTSDGKEVTYILDSQHFESWQICLVIV